MGVLLQTLACAACLTCIPIQRNGSVLPTRVSHVSSEKAIGATQQQGGNPQTMGCHLSKCVILMMFTKGRITITYCITLNTALFIVIQFIVTEYHIF